jgi:hypothetical protein
VSGGIGFENEPNLALGVSQGALYASASLITGVFVVPAPLGIAGLQDGSFF